MSANFTLDDREFRAALVQYSAAADKAFADGVNHQMNNWAIQSQKHIKQAMEGRIRAMQQAPWWPKLISRIMVKRGAASVAKKLAQGKGKTALKRFQERAFTREQARRRSAAVIKRRVNARRFLSGFFLKWSNAIASMVPGIRGPRGTGAAGGFFRSLKASYRPATGNDPRASINVWYDYKKRSGKTLGKVDAMFNRAMRIGMTATISDMEAYTNRKLSEAARKHSAA